MKAKVTVRKTGIRNNNLHVDIQTVEKLDLARVQDVEYLDDVLSSHYLAELSNCDKESHFNEIAELLGIINGRKHTNNFIVILSEKGYMYSWEFEEYKPELTEKQTMKLEQLEHLYNQLYDLALKDDDFNDLLVESKLFPHSLDELAEMVRQLHERV